MSKNEVIEVKMMLSVKIKELRTSKHYTQEEFAEIIGVDVSTVCKWETAVRVPRLSQLYKIANLVGCPVSFFLM